MRQWSAYVSAWEAKQDRENYRAGLIAHVLVAVNTGKKGRNKIPKPGDFFSRRKTKQPEVEQTPEEAREAFAAFVMSKAKGKVIVTQHGGLPS